MKTSKTIIWLILTIALGLAIEVALWPLAKELLTGSDRAIVSLTQIGFAALAMVIAASFFYTKEFVAEFRIQDVSRFMFGFAVAIAALGAVWVLRACYATKNAPLELSQIPICIALFTFVAIREEIVFRFVLFGRLSSLIGLPLANLLQAALFAIAHGLVGAVVNLSDIIYLFGSALLAASVFHYTQSLLVPIVIHAANDLLAAVLFGFNDLSRSGLYFDGLLVPRTDGVGQTVISCTFAAINLALAVFLHRRASRAPAD